MAGVTVTGKGGRENLSEQMTLNRDLIEMRLQTMQRCMERWLQTEE